MTEHSPDLDLARRTLLAEGEAIAAIADRVGKSFADAARLLHDCPGKVVTTGVGKAGIIANKVSATLASTGTQSIYLHPVEALHGDLGRVRRDDVVVVLSHSGASEEVVRLLDHLKGQGAKLVGISSQLDCPLGEYADLFLDYGDVEEACPLGLAPTVSTSCMLAVGDALALTVMAMRKFTPEDFAAFHPGGSLGRKLLKVADAMIPQADQRFSPILDRLPLGEALRAAEGAPRRSGAMVLVDADGRLSGILTDADLRRLLLGGDGDVLLARPVRDVMVRNPKSIGQGELASEALAIINRYRIDELPVVDDEGRPVGLIDVQDLLGIKAVSNGRD